MRIHYEAARTVVRDLDGEGPLSHKTLNDREDKGMLSSVDEGRNDVLIPEELEGGLVAVRCRSGT